MRPMTETLLLQTADYLDALADNMLRNNADMRLDECEDPKDVAARLRAAAEQMHDQQQMNEQEEAENTSLAELPGWKQMHQVKP